MTKVGTMIEPRLRGGELRSELRATQAAIESFCWEFQQWLGKEISSRDAFASELLLREALVNAVEHGCAGIPERQIRCIVRGGRGRILIVVSDYGPGFDWASRLASTPGADATRGRGVTIYKTYATRMRFNAVGNVIYICKNLDRPNGSESVSHD